MADHLSPWTKTFTRDTSKDIYEEVSYDTTKPKFDVVTIENDIIFDFKNYGSSFNGMVFLTASRGLHYLSVNNITSGNIAPTIPSNERQVWFDATTNSIKMYAPNATEYEECCLALCLGTSIANTDFVLNQVFNGFGYIGSTIFALPGVKGLIPNGRNADGSLKNIEFENTVVKTYTISSSEYAVYAYLGNILGIAGVGVVDYKEDSNFNFITSTKEPIEQLLLGKVSLSSSKITSFTSKTTFHALDYNDKSTISDYSTPD